MKLADLSEGKAAQALTLRERFSPSAIAYKLNVQKIIYYYIIY